MAAEKKFTPNIVAFACNWGGFPLLESEDSDLSANVRLIRLMCSGRISVGLLLRAFELGADGVAVFACDDGECHFGFGALKGMEEFELARRMGYLLGIEDERLIYYKVHPGDMGKAQKDMKKFVKKVRKLGRSNVKSGEGL
ncbi:MAG: hydrogenase iron-sulfur subunit [bacterium]